MDKIKTILFAASITESSRSFFNVSAMLATQLNARIIVFHVMEGLQETYEGIAVAIFGEEKWRIALHEHGQRIFQSLSTDDPEKQIVRAVLGELCQNAHECYNAFKPFNRDIIISDGNIVEEIIRQAKNSNCDLVIMGKSGGYSSSNSTSLYINSIIKKAGIPVFLIPPPSHL